MAKSQPFAVVYDVLTRNGKAVAVLLGVDGDDDLERSLYARSKNLNAILDAADRRIAEGRGIEHEALWRQVESNAAFQTKSSAKKVRTPRAKAPLTRDSAK